MKHTSIIFAGVAALAFGACSSGGSSRASATASTPASQFATGPIYSACQKAGRKQASRMRCGCVQAVANQSLSASDQRRGTGFFGDPNQAQVARQSDRDSDERFWRRWKDYSDSAARICT